MVLSHGSRTGVKDSPFLRTDRRQQLDTTFWEAYLPSGESSRDASFTNTVVATWIPTIRYLAGQDSLVRLALDSCVLMAIGQRQANPDFTHHGMAIYGQALARTNRALQDLATAQTDAMLATCELLAICERCRPHTGSAVSTQATEWQRHVKGTFRLLELQGSDQHLHEYRFTLFSHARSGVALSGITRRQRASLDTPEWLQTP